MTAFSKNYHHCIEGNSDWVQDSLIQLQHWFKKLDLKVKVNRERQQLLEMSDAMLGDMGITRAQANVEAHRDDLPAERLITLQKRRC